MGVAVTPDGSRVYVAENLRAAKVVDRQSGTLLATIPLLGQPQSVTISPDGTRAYFPTHAFPGRVEIIDSDPASPTFNTVVGVVLVAGINETIPGLSQPVQVVVTPDGNRAYVALRGGHAVSVINTTNDTAVATIPVPLQPNSLAMVPEGTRVYVASTPNFDPGPLSVIDTDSASPTFNTIIDTITVGVGAFRVAIAPTPPPDDGIGAPPGTPAPSGIGPPTGTPVPPSAGPP